MEYNFSMNIYVGSLIAVLVIFTSLWVINSRSDEVARQMIDSCASTYKSESSIHFNDLNIYTACQKDALEYASAQRTSGLLIHGGVWVVVIVLSFAREKFLPKN